MRVIRAGLRPAFGLFVMAHGLAHAVMPLRGWMDPARLALDFMPVILYTVIVVGFSVAGLAIFSGILPMLYPERGQQMSMMIQAFVLLVSGVYYEVAVLPGWLQWLAYISPATYILDGIRGAKTDVALAQFIADNKLENTAAGRSDIFDVLIAADGFRSLVLEQVVNELRAGWPGRQIDLTMDLPRPINCDHARIGQLLSNLLANALKHGADAPVSVRASEQEGTFEVSVANKGSPIPPAVIKRMFEPFYRPLSGASKEGLGLGLYIAAAIAHAHQGTLDVDSSEDETRFVLRIPAS